MKLGRIKYIKNPEELKAVVNAEVAEALNEVGDKALKRLDEIILRDIYLQEYYPNVRYYGGGSGSSKTRTATPTFQFRQAWNKFVENKLNGQSEMSIKYDSSRVGSSHNSIVDGTDVSEYLNEILNVSGFTSGLSVGSLELGTLRNVSKYRQPYWDNFIREMSTGRKIRTWLKEELKSQGLDVS